MKTLFGLKDLLKEQMRDLYDAETHYGKMLPNLIRTATSPELIERLQAIATQTQSNASHFVEICNALEVPPTGVTCHAMDGLLREAKDTTQDWGDTATIDAALIANAQRIVHYQIAGFGTGRAFAESLGEKASAQLLSSMLDQAADNDKALTRIATGGWFITGINTEAANAAA